MLHCFSVVYIRSLTSIPVSTHPVDEYFASIEVKYCIHHNNKQLNIYRFIVYMLHEYTGL